MSKSRQNKRLSNIISTRPIKKSNNGISSDWQEQELQEPQWVDLGANKTSWIWKYFGIKTDGRAYCRYKILKNGVEVECDYSCVYNTQTSTQQYHLNSAHKEFEKKEQVKTEKIIPHKEPKQRELQNSVIDWLITDSQSFNSANGKGFLRMINKFDPAFQPPCYATIKKELSFGYLAAFQAIKEVIIQTCETAAITTDLWMSHAKSGYIGITCHWLTEKMKLHEILICVEQINYSHTCNNVRQIIISKLESLGLERKVETVITDNCSGIMVKAIREWDNVDRIPCIAHTLQLCIIKGLEKVKIHTNRFKELILFFNSSKQNERLEEAQRELAVRREKQREMSQSLYDNSDEQEKESPLRILRTINDVKTGSSLDSWKSLQELKDPIKRVLLNLKLEDDIHAKKDYKKLKNRYLKDHEWDLLDKLIEVFKPIEEATEWLGGQKYCTLSLMYPAIHVLEYDYIPDISLKEEENIENGESEDDDDDTMKEDSDDESYEEMMVVERDSNFQHNAYCIKIINSVKKAIYDTLFDYLDAPPKAALLASLLDPRFKKMRGWPEDMRQNAISSLKEEYLLLKSKEIAIIHQRNTRPTYHIDGFKSRLFGSEEVDELNDDNELSCYLDNIRTPQALPETDPFQWWIDHELRFPILFKLARKYLSIPAVSVPSEQLFSDAENQITSDRNRLRPEAVNELLFLKRNSEYYNPFV